MAATYSSFMTTRFYSPVFNTALFDGPLRIYFSQSYESAALKVYHLLQSQYPEQWNRLKECSQQSKEHVFLMMYPEKKDLEMIFTDGIKAIHAQEWEEGLAIGFCQPQDDLELTHQLDSINKSIDMWIEKVKNHEISL
jgi:hypothetical protein